MNLFNYIDFETVSICNRRCPTCIRNSHPDRGALQSWFSLHYLPTDIIFDALLECADLGFHGGVCLSHYNEPLMDERLPDIAEVIKLSMDFYPLFLNTNGDFIDEKLAKDLDGKLDKIIVSLYMNDPIKSERKRWIESLFHVTKAEVNTQTDHITTHFSPNRNLDELIEINKKYPCKHEPQMRVIINHKKQYLLCCEDVIGNFDLSTFPETSIKDYWFGKKHIEIAEALEKDGGRLQYPYCATCPRS